jgi:hypothetical protein
MVRNKIQISLPQIEAELPYPTYWCDFIRSVSRGGKKYLNPKNRHFAQEYTLVPANYLPPNHYVYSERKIYSQNFTHKTDGERNELGKHGTNGTNLTNLEQQHFFNIFYEKHTAIDICLMLFCGNERGRKSRAERRWEKGILHLGTLKHA